METSPAPTLLASRGSLERHRIVLTSFTAMHMAQIRTNILPRSCSQLILCVRAKGCGRAWEGTEEGGEDKERRGKGDTSSGGTRLHMHAGPSRWTTGRCGTPSPGPACLTLSRDPEFCSEDKALRANNPQPTCMGLFNHVHYQTLRGASSHSSVEPRLCTPLTDG